MSLKIRRYNAENSEFEQNGRTRTEIQIPGTVGFTDLTTSKLVLDMKVVIKEGATEVMLPSTFGDAAGAAPASDMCGPVALIRNTKVVSQDFGLLNERRHVNVIDSNLNWYKKSRAQEDAEATFGNSVNRNYGCDPMSGLPDCPFLDYSRPSANAVAQTAASVTRRAELPVPWSAIDNLGKVSNFPNVAVGDIAYRIELEDQIDVVMPAEMPAIAAQECEDATAANTLLGKTTPLITKRQSAQHWRAPRKGDEIKVTFVDSASNKSLDDVIESVAILPYAAGDNTNRYAITLKTGVAPAGATDVCSQISVNYSSSVLTAAKHCTDTAAPTADLIGSALQPLLVEGLIDSDSPAEDPNWGWQRNCFYVGAPVRVSAYRANEIRTQDTTITSVKLDAANGKVEVVLATPLDLTTLANAVTNTYLGFREDLNNVRFTATWTVDEMYAQLHEIQLMPSQQESARKALANLEIPFTNQMLVQRAMPASTSMHTEVVHAPPMVSGMTVLSPQNQQMVSGYDGCTSYRYAINGKETTNRDILVGNASQRSRQLHNHGLKRYFGNLNQQLKKYDAPYVDYANVTADANQRQHSMYPLVLPIVPQEQIVQLQMSAVNLNGNAMGAKNLFFVFDQMKALKLSNGRVSVV